MALPKVVPYSLRTLDDTLKNILSSGKIFTAKELVPLVKKKMLMEKDDSEVLGYIQLRLEKADVFIDYGGSWGTAKLQDRVHDTVEEILIAEDAPLAMADICKAVHKRVGPLEELSLAKDGRFVEYDDSSWGISAWLVRDVLSPRQLDQVYNLLSNSPPLSSNAISQQLFDQPAAANDLENKISCDKRFCQVGINWSIRKANSQQGNLRSSSDEIIQFQFAPSRERGNITSYNDLVELLNRVGMICSPLSRHLK